MEDYAGAVRGIRLVRCRCACPGVGGWERVPDHSWLSRTRARLPHEVHTAVFDWVLALIAEAGLVKGERIGVCGARHRRHGDRRWSLTSLRERLIKTGARLVRHGRYAIFQMAEAALSRQLFAGILGLINGLRDPPVATGCT